MVVRILFAIIWFTVTGLVSIDYIERLREKGELWRAIIAFPLLIILAPIIGLGGVAGQLIEALIDDGQDEDGGANV